MAVPVTPVALQSVVVPHGVDCGHDGEAGEDEAEPEESAHAALGELLLVQHLEERDVEQGAARHAIQNADDERLDAGGCIDVFGDDEADGDAHGGRQGHEHDVEHHVSLLSGAGRHLHADAEQDGHGVQCDGHKQFPHVA